ncbi:MAG: O-antigen ligase family protein [Caldilineaceae bacterium]|nr:O-antigen ligase family protein [Caldilineaceae bacterium]
MRSIVFALSLVFIFFIPWEGVVQLPGVGTGAKLVGFVLAALWVATVVITNRLRKPGPFQIAVAAFVLWNALSVFWSADPETTIVHVQTWVQLLGMVLIMWDLFTTRAAISAGLQAFVLGQYVAIGTAASNFFSGNVFYPHYQRFSPSDHSNPDGYGNMVALGIPVAWYLANRKSTTRIGTLLRFVNYAYIFVAFLGITLSGTRSALLAAIPGVAFGLASLTRLRLWARITIFMVMMLAVLIALPYVQTMRSFQRFSTTANEITEGDLNGRTVHWMQGLEAFVDHPLLGVGADMYRSITSRGNLAHNSFISVLVELGLIGFALFGIILTLTVLSALEQPKWDRNFWLTVFMVWGIGASSLTYEYRRATWLVLCLIVASGSLAAQNEEAKQPSKRDEPETQATRSAKRSKWARDATEKPQLGYVK